MPSDSIINLNVSLNYCSDWTPAMIVRELFANARDANPDGASLEVFNNQLVVYNQAALDENGEPVTLHPIHWTMGVSDKHIESAIGRFGEGFKVLIAALLRLGYTDIIIRSGKFVYRPFAQTVEYDEELATKRVKQVSKDNRVAHVRAEVRDEFFDGTQVIVKDWYEGDFTEIFLDLNDSVVVWNDREYALIEEEVPHLYVAGIRICTMDSIFDRAFRYGYAMPGNVVDLNRDRERPSSNQVRSGIEYILKRLTDSGAWEQLWEAHRKNEDLGDLQVEWRWFTGYSAVEPAIVQAIKSVYGDDVCIHTANHWASSVEAEGTWKILNFTKRLNEKLIKFGIPTDEAIHSQLVEQDDTSLKLDQVKLDANQSRTVRMLRNRVKKYSKLLDTQVFPIECQDLGVNDDGEVIPYIYSETGDTVFINTVIAFNRREAFKALVEICIYRWYGFLPEDWGYERQLTQFAAILMEHLI